MRFVLVSTIVLVCCCCCHVYGQATPRAPPLPAWHRGAPASVVARAPRFVTPPMYMPPPLIPLPPVADGFGPPAPAPGPCRASWLTRVRLRFVSLPRAARDSFWHGVLSRIWPSRLRPAALRREGTVKSLHNRKAWDFVDFWDVASRRAKTQWISLRLQDRHELSLDQSRDIALTCTQLHELELFFCRTRRTMFQYLMELSGHPPNLRYCDDTLREEIPLPTIELQDGQPSGASLVTTSDW